MSWLAQGTDNEDLVNQLCHHKVLQNSNAIMAAFRMTDRGDFIPSKHRSLAYFDRPFKQGYYHLSAPHMYASVLEYLDLKHGQSFLNVGSGTGYLSCLAACLLGESGLSHGIEINANLVAHSRICCENWFSKLLLRRKEGEDGVPAVSRNGVEFVQGNCFDIDLETSVKSCRYDRIYIGAGCPQDRVEFFYSLLAKDGKMIVPVDETNKLMNIHRQSHGVYYPTFISFVHYAALVLPYTEDEDDAEDDEADMGSDFTSSSTTAAVSLSSVVAKRSLVRLPCVLWCPEKIRHQQFSQEFKNSVHALLLVANKVASPLHSVLTILPTHLWIHIITFMSRDWFVPTPSKEEQLQADLVAERALRKSAEEKLAAALAETRRLEREAVVHKLLFRRLKDAISSSHPINVDVETALFGIGSLNDAMVVHGTDLHQDDDNDDDNENEGDNADDGDENWDDEDENGDEDDDDDAIDFDTGEETDVDRDDGDGDEDDDDGSDDVANFSSLSSLSRAIKDTRVDIATNYVA